MPKLQQENERKGGSSLSGSEDSELQNDKAEQHASETLQPHYSTEGECRHLLSPNLRKSFVRGTRSTKLEKSMQPLLVHNGGTSVNRQLHHLWSHSQLLSAR